MIRNCRSSISLRSSSAEEPLGEKKEDMLGYCKLEAKIAGSGAVGEVS